MILKKFISVPTREIDYIPRIVDSTQNYVQVTPDGTLKVEGIESWVNGLLPIEEFKYDGDGATMLRMVDEKTGALFLIRRLK